MKRFVLPLLVVTLAFSAADPAWAGKKKKKKKNKEPARTLTVAPGADLSAYTGVFLGDVDVDYEAKKEKKRVQAEGELVGNIRFQLPKYLRKETSLEHVSPEAPEDASSGTWLRLDCKLEVDPGSRAARHFVSYGAGKSKSTMTIRLLDAEGNELGVYEGAGTGWGGFKGAGGSAVQMTKDDIQENSKRFAILLEGRRSGPR